MASSLFALLDDIATVLDDVAVLTKVAAKKASGILGDDLALNAQQVAGVSADREWPVVWAVAKGSTRNKVILVPAALAISAFAPWLVVPLLVVGGAYLSYEGVEKVVHALWRHDADREHEAELHAALLDPQVDLVALERDKIQGAIRTDFILSAEIIVITLGTVPDEPFFKRLAVLVVIAALMTVGVYGLVAGIVKLDDAGLALSRRANRAARALGRALVVGAPWFMRLLSFAGTAAMFLVGGGILAHNVHVLHEIRAEVATNAALEMLFDFVCGLVLGIVVLLAVKVVNWFVGRVRARGPVTRP